MRISAIGCGYLGAVHAASTAELGHGVVGIDVDERKVAALCEGRAPFYEPDPGELLQHSLASGQLSSSADVQDAASAQVHFVCVGTP
jgi:UDPglucose 6-dehydrogenase